VENKDEELEIYGYHIEGRTQGFGYRNEFTKSKVRAEQAAMENWTVRTLYVKESETAHQSSSY
jgi:hypothetical protein